MTRQQRRQLARERAKKQLERERREARSQGGQPGHEGSSRPPAEPEQLTAGPFDCVPGRCGCGHRFTGGEERVGDPVGHQQWELPVVVAEVREWRRLRLECPDCGKPALAELPAGVSLSAFGPRLHAHVAVLAGVCRLSREKIVELLGECYGIELSTGAVDGMLRRVSRVLHDPWRELHEAIKLAEAVHADETTWLCKADPCWLWTATTAALVCYRIDPRRTQQAAKKLLGENFGGFVTSDRYVGYHWLDVLQQQLCWAHAVRQLTELSERPARPASSALGCSTSPARCSRSTASMPPRSPAPTIPSTRRCITSVSGRADPLPLGEQIGLSFENPSPPPLEPLVGPQPSILLPSPAPQVEVDAPQEGMQHGPVVPAVIVHPPGDNGVQPFRQVVQRQVGAPVDPQLAEPVASGFERLGADRRQERREAHPVLAVDRLPRPEGEPEEGEARVLVLSPTVAVRRGTTPARCPCGPFSDAALPNPA